MSATNTTAASMACPNCQTVNSAAARFCLTCGSALQATANGRAPLPPEGPSAPPLPPPPPANANGFLGAPSAAAPTVLPLDLDSAFSVALQAVRTAGGTVKAQRAPYLIQCELTKRSWMTTGGLKLRYDGELSLAPAGPRQTAVQATLRLQPSSRTSILVMYGVTCVFLMFAWPGLGLFVGLGSIVFAWQRFATRMPVELSEQLASAMVSSAPDAVMAPVPNSLQRAQPSAGPASEDVVGQLRQLGELRDIGVITPEEFERKKTELLARL